MKNKRTGFKNVLRVIGFTLLAAILCWAITFITTVIFTLAIGPSMSFGCGEVKKQLHAQEPALLAEFNAMNFVPGQDNPATTTKFIDSSCGINGPPAISIKREFTNPGNAGPVYDHMKRVIQGAGYEEKDYGYGIYAPCRYEDQSGIDSIRFTKQDNNDNKLIILNFICSAHAAEGEDWRSIPVSSISVVFGQD